MSEPSFVHLHVHSHFSLLDGCIHHKALTHKAAELGMPALALTDHGSLFGAIEFYTEARRRGVKPIIGMEAYVTRGSRLDRDPNDALHHITLLARDECGYKNLIRLSSLAYTEGFYRKPRIDNEIMSQYSAGLTALSGCMGGLIPQTLAAGNLKAAEERSRFYRELFDPDHFYLEIMRNGVRGQKEMNEGLIALSNKTGIPLVATNDVHYLDQADSLVHEVMLCINTRQTLNEENRMKMESDQFFFRSASEMAELFRDLPEAVDNTVRIASQCNLDLDFDEYHLPEFSHESGKDPVELLRELCFAGARRLFKKIVPEIKERLETELEVINSMGFPSYFLIVWDFIRYAKENKIPVGPGRGSAAGSLVAYCLGITEVNPLDYDLIFERFLNSSRISMPDIDIDFCRDGREKVIQYVQEKYGASNVCQIVTFGTMAARAAVRDAGRVLGIELQTVDKIAKKIPGTPGTQLKQALDTDPDLKAYYDSDATLRELFEISLKIEGLNRHASTHAAGVVITDRPLMDYVPLCRVQNEINTQYQMEALERIGLLKMDFLGLKNLTIMDKAAKLIRETRKVDVDLSSLPFDDEETFRLLQKGRTLGIFQLESEGMSNLLVRMKPDNFKDIIALLALYRPGPLKSGMVDSFVRRKHGEEPVDFLHDSIKDVLRETYGVIVYQEQVMRIANRLAGFSMNEADSLRKAMGKKKADVMARFRDEFIEGAVAKGVDREKADHIYNQIEYFAGYGFNKSHSTAYGIITYQTAYLKANFPLEFMAALMSCDASNSDKIAEYLQECKRMGIKVLGPDVNESSHDFTPVGESVRFGLSAIKGIGDKAIENMIDARRSDGRFKSMQDFLLKVDLKAANKIVMEALIKAGAFDSFDQTRASYHHDLDGLLRWAARVQADRLSGQQGLFGGDAEMIKITDQEEWEEGLLLAHEKEVLGFAISVDLCEKYGTLAKLVAPADTQNLLKMEDGAFVTVAGVLSNPEVTLAKSGRNVGRKMARFKIRTGEFILPAVMFVKEYEQFEDMIQDDTFRVFKGFLDRSREDVLPSVKVTSLATVEETLQSDFSALIVRLGKANEAGEEVLDKIKALAEEYPGSVDLILNFETDSRKAYTIRAGSRYKMRLGEEVIGRLEALLGEGNIVLR